MRGPSRDFLVALIPPVLVAVITPFTTALSPWEIAGVFLGTFAACFLVIAAFHAVRRKLESWRDGIAAAATEAALRVARAEVDAHLAEAGEIAPGENTVAISNDPFVLPSPGRLLIEGRELQAALVDVGEYGLLPAELAMKIARWEAVAINILADWPDRLNDFKRAASTLFMSDLTGNQMYNRLTSLLAEVESVVIHPTDPW
jgi:hypothetical protein